MTLALKAFKHHPSLSEETMAFDAIVTWHGRPIYHARNDGRGGMTRLRPVSEGDSEDRSAAQRANASREREYLQHTPDVIVQLGPDLEDWVDSWRAGRSKSHACSASSNAVPRKLKARSHCFPMASSPSSTPRPRIPGSRPCSKRPARPI
jgi:hypothetical protein